MVGWWAKEGWLVGDDGCVCVCVCACVCVCVCVLVVVRWIGGGVGVRGG